jgi:hypothetical protein
MKHQNFVTWVKYKWCMAITFSSFRIGTCKNQCCVVLDFYEKPPNPIFKNRLEQLTHKLFFFSLRRNHFIDPSTICLEHGVFPKIEA